MAKKDKLSPSQHFLQVTHLIIFSLFFSFILCINSLTAQKYALFNESKHKIEFLYGYGSQDPHHIFSVSRNSLQTNTTDKGDHPDGNNPRLTYVYQVTFYQFQYSYSWVQRENWQLDAIVIPQYNSTKYRATDGSTNQEFGYEYGLNIGVLLRRKIINDDMSMYAMISSGPHYVSGTPARQAKGFIFSDNVFVGINVKLSRKFYFDLRPGIRHISNASLKIPNGGVNDYVLTAGIMLAL